MTRRKNNRPRATNPKDVARPNAADHPSTAEQKARLEQILPPYNVVPVTFGEWTNPVDERIAPFVREMLVAGFPTMFCGIDTFSVTIAWPQSQRAAEFLNIVAPYESGPGTLYSRAAPDAEITGRIPKWSYELTAEDINPEKDEPRESTTANFLFVLWMKIPLQDLGTVTERLKAHNDSIGAQARSAGTGSTRRKVHVKGGPAGNGGQESLWASAIGAETAFIENVPFVSDEVAWHDVVRLSPSGDVLEVLERLTRTRRGTYQAAEDRQEALEQWRAINDHFDQRGIVCESAVPGMFAMAVPTTVSDEELLDLYMKCPVKLGVFSP
jgi:hypothetical protein